MSNHEDFRLERKQIVCNEFSTFILVKFYLKLFYTHLKIISILFKYAY